MNSNYPRNKNQIHNNYTMSTRIHFPIHYWRINRNLPIKLISRHYSTRHILRSCTLPLRTKNRSCIWHFRRNQPLIPTIYRTHHAPTMSQSPILLNIHWCKPNILPSTLLRIKRYTTTIFRLPRHIHKMKCSFIIRGNSVIRSTSYFHLCNLRSIRCTTTSNRNISHTIINGMRRHAPTRIP